MRFCFPGWFGPRGAGLGNELIPLAKAFIASQELGIPFLPTAWGLNQRGYRRYFGTSRFDWVRLYALSRLLPAYTFREEDYRATGEIDYDRAVRVYAERMGLAGKRHYVFMTDGLWGELYPIRKSKPFVLQTLYATRYTVPNMYEFRKQLAGGRNVTVSVNIRLTDFKIPTPTTDYRGLWNTRIPLEWYTRVCRSLRDLLGGAVTFCLVTDGTPEELADFISEFKPVTTFHQKHREISDLLNMTTTDALVCSISSYSQWAAFLSDAPYFWYRPHLRPVDGRLTIWEYLGERPEADAPGAKVFPRGIPVDDDGAIPGSLSEHFRMRRSLNQLSLDLVQSGGVPEPAWPSADSRR
jgi:hypothetical protein